MLGIAGGQQVMLKVRIAEMDRNIAKQFGVNLAGRQDRRRLDPDRGSTANQFSLVGQALERSLRRRRSARSATPPAAPPAIPFGTLARRRHLHHPEQCPGPA